MATKNKPYTPTVLTGDANLKDLDHFVKQHQADRMQAQPDPKSKQNSSSRLQIKKQKSDGKTREGKSVQKMEPLAMDLG